MSSYKELKKKAQVRTGEPADILAKDFITQFPESMHNREYLSRFVKDRGYPNSFIDIVAEILDEEYDVTVSQVAVAGKKKAWKEMDVEEGKMLKKFYSDIKKNKEALKKKAKSKGIYENFGDKEIRNLKDKYSDYFIYKEFQSALDEFDNWCGYFDMSQIEGSNKIQSYKELKKISARTIGEKWIKEVKNIIDRAEENGLTGINEIFEDVINKLPLKVFDIWEGSYTEVQRIVNDYVMRERNSSRNSYRKFRQESINKKATIQLFQTEEEAMRDAESLKTTIPSAVSVPIKIIYDEADGQKF